MNLSLDKDTHPTAAGGTQLRDIRKSLPLRVLTEQDWEHWQRRGYVIVRQAVPLENAKRLAALLWEFDERDPNDPSTWVIGDRRPHPMKELNNAGMLEIYNHQFLWDNRQSPRIYDAFVDIWDRTDLWVSIDRANLSLPKPGADPESGFIHWDVDTTLDPLPISVQGVLSLTRQDYETGGFQCVPWLFEHFDSWAADQPIGRDGKHPDVTGLEKEKIEMEPGDLMIFNALLAHGVRPNTSKDRVRMAQYISMAPAEQDDDAQRQERIRLWQERDHPRRAAFPGDPRDWEKRNADVAELNALGRKLLGLDDW